MWLRILFLGVPYRCHYYWFIINIVDKFNSSTIADKYAFDTLYVTTQTLAEQDANKNRFKIRGQYSSASSSDISLNSMNIPEGSAGLKIERVAYLANGMASEFTLSLYRGDAYDFVAELRLADQ